MSVVENHSLSRLAGIDSPKTLRLIPVSELDQVAAELRQFMIHSVSQTGGHFSSGLGVVELTIALHYVFNTPVDRLIWDVGHQSYPHKILTGRRRQMFTLRQLNGLCGFPKREESVYDCFGTGHSSTAVSAALGMAMAAKQRGDDSYAIAVIGDGAVSGGMALEALNHAGEIAPDNLLVILNDNGMSISECVGGLSRYLNRVWSSKLCVSAQQSGKQIAHRQPMPWGHARNGQHDGDALLVPGELFEEIGFNYVGPVDGHDLPGLIETLENVRAAPGPKLLHVATRKGKGYSPAEANPSAYHGIGKFDPDRGRPRPTSGQQPTFTQAFSQWICDMAQADERLVSITPAMCTGSGLVDFAQRYADRFYDVGIAEQHSVTLAAGMACEGLKPVVSLYSSFLQRAYDQLIHDVALQNLPVMFAIDRGGIVGPDGPTHAGVFDFSYMRAVPNMVVMAPADVNECRQMLYTAYTYNGPAAVRYPRGSGLDVKIDQRMTALTTGRAQMRRKGRQVALLAFGTMLEPALNAATQLDATVVNMRFVKPLDRQIIRQLAQTHSLLVTIEENSVVGGAGSGVNDALAAMKLQVAVVNLGLPDRFSDQGDRHQLLSKYGLDADGIIRSVADHVSCAKPLSSAVAV